jgi:hypothetical protein
VSDAGRLGLVPRAGGGSEGGGQAQDSLSRSRHLRDRYAAHSLNWDLNLGEEVKGEDKLRVHCPDHGFSETATLHTRLKWDRGRGLVSWEQRIHRQAHNIIGTCKPYTVRN